MQDQEFFGKMIKVCDNYDLISITNFEYSLDYLYNNAVFWDFSNRIFQKRIPYLNLEAILNLRKSSEQRFLHRVY